jgi:tRNA dimethylallyltransferase
MPHHLINSLSIHDEYNAGRFEEDALKCIEQIFLKRDTAILCGGSGLYIDLVCKGSDNLPSRNSEIRDELTKLYKESGIEGLQKRLAALDPEFYTQVDVNNPHRMIRALEVCILTGKKYSELRKGKKKQRAFSIIKIGLEDEREKVYQRINERVDEMMKQGLLEEAKKLYPHRHLNALQTVGYKELFDYLDEKISLPEAVNRIKQHTRNYAKRQWTWFRKDKEIHWFSPTEYEKIIMVLSN